MDIFDDPEAVASYAQRPRRQAPGFAEMQRMALGAARRKGAAGRPHPGRRGVESDEVWLFRYAAFAASSDAERAQASQTRAMMAERPMALSPEDDEAMLDETGFDGVSLFYAAYTFRGWVPYA